MAFTRTSSLPLSSTALLPVVRLGSGGTHRLRLRPSQNASSTSFLETAPKVPMEILENIIEQFANIILAPSLQAMHIDSPKSAFRRFFRTCTLVSKGFRHLALRAFFRNLILSTPGDSSRLLRFLEEVNTRYNSRGEVGGYLWVRFLSSPSFLIPPNIGLLRNLIRLKELHVDFSHSGLSLQSACLKQLFGCLATCSSVSGLTSLKLTELPRIDHCVLSLVAKGLPNLVHIHLTSTDSLDMDCCPNCYEDSLTRITHSPISEIYHDVIALADAFGRALAPLKNLTSVFFGLFLSSYLLLDLHINHNWKQSQMKPSTVETIFNCVRCASGEVSTKQRELLASLIIAHHVESLHTVGWASAYGDPCPTRRVEDASNVNALSGTGDRAADIRAYSGLALNPPRTAQDDENIVNRPPCICSDHGLKTTLMIHRAAGKVSVSRLDHSEATN